MESENGTGIDKNQKYNDGDQSTEDKSLNHSNSSASSISTSSLDSNPLSDANVNDSISGTQFENDDYKSTPGEWSIVSVSPRSAYSHTEFGTYSSVSTTLPPQPQVMGRPPEYPGFDPNRIPASVFATNKPASGMEWSVASNESLFSIQMGNMSFTRDQFNWMKSGELNPEFANNLPGLPTINETPSNNSYGLPVVNEVELDKTNKETSTAGERIRLSDRSSNASDGHGMHPALEPHTPARVSQQSDGSRMSTNSFAFPV